MDPDKAEDIAGLFRRAVQDMARDERALPDRIVAALINIKFVDPNDIRDPRLSDALARFWAQFNDDEKWESQLSRMTPDEVTTTINRIFDLDFMASALAEEIRHS